MVENTAGTPPGRPVIFGEVLFDVFPDVGAVLGGAPFNVAWHLQGFGLQPLFVSRVGTDAHADTILARMQEWGMDAGGLQRDPAHPTGTVRISFDDAGHSFDILPDQAYDYIDAQQALDALGSQDLALLYAGTLAARSEVSRATLDAVIGACGVPLFVDINLREPWWDHARVVHTLANARWAKLNDEELAAVLRHDIAPDQLAARAGELRAQHALELLVLTQGAEGACLVGAGGNACAAAPPVAELVDTVGAGDAFSAVTLLGLLAGWAPQRILSRALAFAARICQQRGATASDPDLYLSFREQWRDEHDA